MPGPTRRRFFGLPLTILALLAAVPPVASAGDRVALADQLLAALDRVFKGPHPGERAIHAKGLAVRGTFTPDPEAGLVSAAAHLNAADPVPVIVRFSVFSGIPSQADGKPGTNPAGMAIKFLLPDNVDTDIIAHAYDGFPVSTPEEFVAYLNAMATDDPSAREAFLAEHAAARAFVEAPKPTPASYGSAAYYGVHAFRFTNAAALSRFGRYRIRPAAGERYLSPVDAKALPSEYLHDEMVERLRHGPVRFRLTVQLAASGDPITDPTKPWPDGRSEVLLGTLALTSVINNGDPGRETLFFSPLNLVPGIAASPDPLLAARTRPYALSYRRRTQAE